jgi:hypothetical protein
MRRQRAVRIGLAMGLVSALAGLGFGVVTGVVPDSTTAGVPGVAVLLALSLLSVSVSLAAGSAYLALRHRVLVPLFAVVGFAVGAIALERTVRGLQSGEALVSVLIVGPLLVVLALLEALGRARLGRLAAPPSRATWRALSVGVMAALLYTGVVAIRVLVPLQRVDTGMPSGTPGLEVAVTLWYVFGTALVLVGLPVALNRRYGLVGPAVGLVAVLAVDLAFVQPAVAAGTEPVVALLLAVWPIVAAGLAAVGGLEWWLRARRGEYDRPDDGSGGADDGRVTVEGGLFGDRA